MISGTAQWESKYLSALILALVGRRGIHFGSSDVEKATGLLDLIAPSRALSQVPGVDARREPGGGVVKLPACHSRMRFNLARMRRYITWFARSFFLSLFG